MPALLLTLALCPAPGWANQPQASRYYEDALKRFQAQDAQGAIIQLKNALQIDRSMLQVHLLLGKASLAVGEVVAAEVALNEALRLGVNRAEVVLPLAQALVQQGRPQSVLDDPRFELAGLPPGVAAELMLAKAGAAADVGDLRGGLSWIDQARRLGGSPVAAWVAEVSVRIRSGQLAEARAAAERAAQAAPRDADAWHARAQVAHAEGRLADALAAYDQALPLRPDNLEVLIARAGLQFDLGRIDDALRDAEAAQKLSAIDPRAAYLRALVFERQGRAAPARDAYNAVTALLDPVPPEFLRYRPQLLMLGGMAHFSLRQPEKAQPYLDRVQRLQPGSPVAKVLAQIHLQQGNPSRATEVLEAYLRTTPQDAQASQLLASIHLGQGRYLRANQLLQQALQHGDRAQLHSLLGMSLMGEGRLAAAATELETALKRDPGHVQAGSALVALYLESGQAAKAVRVVDELVRRHPRQPGLLMLQGQARAAAGQAAAARKAFDAALALDPAFDPARLGLARLAREAGDLAGAARLAEAVLAQRKDSLEALAELAAVREAQGRAADAQGLLIRADDVSGPRNVTTSLALLEFQLRQRRPDLARQALERAQAKAPESLPTLLASVRVFIAQGDLAAARTAATRAAGVAGYDAAALLRIGLLQLEAGHPAGAAHALDKALQQRPDFLPALAARAETDIRLGDLAQAEARARQVLAKAPRLGVGHALLGDVALAGGRPDDALPHFRRAQDAEPSSANLMRLVSVLPEAEGLNLLRAWRRGHENDLVVLRAIGDAEARAGRYDAARAAYTSLSAAVPQDAEVLNNLANLMILAGDRGALAVAERALALKPQAAHIVGTAGWAAHHAGQNDRALQLLRDARLRDPANADTRYFLAVVLAETGRRDEARSELDAALQGGTTHASAARTLRARLP